MTTLNEYINMDFSLAKPVKPKIFGGAARKNDFFGTWGRKRMKRLHVSV